MACDHDFKPTHDGTHICRHCGVSTGPAGFRVPNNFVPVPATALDVTAISIGVGFGGSLILALVALGISGAAGAFVLTGRLLARTAGF